MASKSYAKGRRNENDLVKIFLRHGIPARRTPMSRKPDIVVSNEPGEVKVRNKLSRFLTEPFPEHTFLFLRQDYGLWLAVMDLEQTFIPMLLSHMAKKSHGPE